MSLYFILIGILIILPIDIYYYRALNKLIEKLNIYPKMIIRISYWIYTLTTIAFLFFIASYFTSKQVPPKFARVYLFGIVFIILLSKIIGSFFILLHDLKSLFIFLRKKLFQNNTKEHSPSRRQFLKKSAIVASIIPFGTLMFGVIKSAFDYKVRKQSLIIPNLPPAFKGLKIVQSMISGKKVSYEDSGLGKREWNELMETLELKDKII